MELPCCSEKGCLVPHSEDDEVMWRSVILLALGVGALVTSGCGGSDSRTEPAATNTDQKVGRIYKDALGHTCDEGLAHYGDHWPESGLTEDDIWCPASVAEGGKVAKARAKAAAARAKRKVGSFGNNQFRDANRNVCQEDKAHFGDHWVKSGLDANQVWCPASAPARAKLAKPVSAAPPPEVDTSTVDTSTPGDNGQLLAIQSILCPTNSLSEISGFADEAASKTSHLSPQDVIDLVLMEDYNGQSCVEAFALAVALAP